MSYIRALEDKKYSKNDKPLYAFLSGAHPNNEELPNNYFIESYGDLKVPEHYVEITCRILSRAGVPLTLDEVNKLRKELNLEPIDRIKADKEVQEKDL